MPNSETDFRLYNTLSRKIEFFTPLNYPIVNMYTCGPTVYDYTHIGHLRKFVMDDVLKKSLEFFGYKVKHVMNITDVGHLVSDADIGEDKLEKGARRTGKTAWEVAAFYTEHFLQSIDKVGITRPQILCKATDHVEQMIKLVKMLQDKGFAYATDQAIYFDTSKDSDYGRLSGQRLDDKQVAVRDEIQVDPLKKHPADFALMFKCVGRFAKHQMRWQSPWGEVFPGWHIECSAMSMYYLGETIDIHTGGIDHIPIHHENEIAQSESATDKLFVKYWVHHNFLNVEGEKMSKSLGNFLRLEDIVAKGIDPLVLRFLFLQSHYRQQMNFTWRALLASATSYDKLRKIFAGRKVNITRLNRVTQVYYQRFAQALANDLQIPSAVAVLWDVVKSDLTTDEKAYLISQFDKVLGLNLLTPLTEVDCPERVKELVKQREQARKLRDFALADKLRQEILDLGYLLEDEQFGTKLIKNIKT